MPRQTVARCDEHPTTFVESDISRAELLGIVDYDDKYRKRDFNSREVNLIKNHLEDTRNATVDESTGLPITPDNV